MVDCLVDEKVDEKAALRVELTVGWTADRLAGEWAVH